MVCKGICIRYKAPKPPSYVGGRYGIGQKRCQVCGVFIKWNEGIWCPCCHGRLRIKPRSPKSKQRILFALKQAKVNKGEYHNLFS